MLPIYKKVIRFHLMGIDDKHTLSVVMNSTVVKERHFSILFRSTFYSEEYSKNKMKINVLVGIFCKKDTHSR